MFVIIELKMRGLSKNIDGHDLVELEYVHLHRIVNKIREGDTKQIANALCNDMIDEHYDVHGGRGPDIMVNDIGTNVIQTNVWLIV